VERQAQDSIRLVASTPRGEWEDACAAFADATAFHRYDFLQSIAPLLDCRFIPLRVLLRDQPVGVAPLMVKGLGPFCTINWVPFPYLGPLVPAELIPVTLSALRLEAKRRRAVNHQQSFSQVTGGHGGEFTSCTDRTFVVPLSGRSDQELLTAMHHSRRKEIRSAQRIGFEVCTAETVDFRLMDVWLKPVYSAQGLPTAYRPGTYERIFDALYNAPRSLFHAARIDGRTVALAVVFSTARRAFAWQSAVDPSFRSKFPQVLLKWHALRWARDAGATEFDLVGAPNEGIANYKSRFGSLEQKYTILRREAGPHRIALSAMSRLRSH
jgi:hypothetical protein